MERLQSTWENRVALEPLGERRASAARRGARRHDEDRAALLAQALGYPADQRHRSSCARRSRRCIRARRRDHVQVTNGGSEANCITLMHLVEPGDEVVVMTPNYMQVRGLARGARRDVRALAARARTRARRSSRGGGPISTRCDALVTDRTRAILICNPNNPTGARLTPPSSTGSAAIAAKRGAWVVSDEIYRGAELDGVETPTSWGRYERAIVTSGLSKAYGLPGLRDRLGRRAAGAHRGAVGRPRLHDDRPGRDQRSARADRARAGAARAAARADARHPPHQLSRVKRWIERRAGALAHPSRSGRHRVRPLRAPRSTRRR